MSICSQQEANVAATWKMDHGQRHALLNRNASTLLAEPRILILDEPTAGIDIGSKAEIIALVRDLAKRGKAIIVISSELSELLTAADRLIVMVNGRAARDCPRSEFDDPDPSDDEGARLQYAERQLSKTLQQAHAHV